MSDKLSNNLTQLKQELETVTTELRSAGTEMEALLEQHGGRIPKDDEKAISQYEALEQRIESSDAKRGELLEEARSVEMALRGTGAEMPEFQKFEKAVKREQRVQSSDMEQWSKEVAPKLAGTNARSGDSPDLLIKATAQQLSLAKRALVASENVTGGLQDIISSHYDGGPFQRELNILDLFRTIPVSGGDTVSWMRQSANTNAAAGYPKQDAVSGGGTATKAESTMVWTQEKVDIETIANWIPVTRDILSDWTMLQAIIRDQLQYNVLEALEDMIINGDETTPGEFDGILETPGIGAVTTGSDAFARIAQAKTDVMVDGKARPDVVIMNPQDWQDILLLQDNEARYYYGGPMSAGNPVLWGMPIVVSEAITAKTVLVGATRHAIIFDREQITTRVTDSHADYFVRNMLAILSELRAGFVVDRPSAWVEVTLA